MQETTSTTDNTMSEFQAYLSTLRSEATRTGYEIWARKAVGDPDAFIRLARSDRLKAEEQLTRFMVEARTHAGGSTLRNYRAAVKGFLDYYEVSIAWRKIKALAPPAKAVASDRAPELEELRRMWAVADPRQRLAMAFLVSLGGRRGAFQFPSARGGHGYMRLRDVTYLDDGTAAVVVYPGEPEEYRTLASPEAVQQLKLCLELRERVGEKVGPDSPVLRDEWHSEYAWHPEEAHVIDAESVSVMFRRLKMKAGISTSSRSGGFKAAHGFRKFFKSNFPACPQHGDLEADVLMGHRRSYDKLTWDHLRERYRVAIPSLVIDEKFRLQEELKAAKDEDEHYHLKLEHDYLMADKRVRDLEENQARINELVKELVKRGVIPETSLPSAADP
jgi:hypothetical protein